MLGLADGPVGGSEAWDKRARRGRVATEGPALNFCSCKAGESFGKVFETKVCTREMALSPTAFPAFRPAIAKLIRRGTIVDMKMTILIKNFDNRPLLRAFLFVPLLLTCSALVPQARADCQDACLTNNNTVQGDNALLNLTTGTENTALGFNALLSNTSGYHNTGIGSQALTSNTVGVDNIAVGWQTLFLTEDGNSNVAIGYQALYQNISGNSNIAIGNLALNANTGSANIAIGSFTGENNTTGTTNTAVGFNTMHLNITGSGNCAFGNDALNSNSQGSNNTAIGVGALLETLGSNNVGLGYLAGQYIGIGSDNIEIGNDGLPSDSRTIRIGAKQVHRKTFIAGINGATVPTGVPVIVDANGHLGTTTSSGRFKEAIKPMDKTSETILALKPVTFRYKRELDPARIPQFGLVAEQVAKVNPDLVVRDAEGKAFTVRYEAVNAMLLNEFIKARRQIDSQQKQIDALTAGLQKVSAQVELNKAESETVSNNY